MIRKSADREWVCAQCGALFDSLGDGMAATVNVTRDLLYVEDHHFQLDEAVIEPDIALDFCNVPCFLRWIWKAAVALQPQRRP